VTAFERLLAALDAHGSKVTGSGSRRMAQCPSHEDRDPSLSVTAIEGQALIHCHAGCRTDDVLAAIGSVMGDLFDDPRGARYAYTDAAGTPTRFVHRTPDKAFKQSGDTKGRPQLYRLPAVIEAVTAGTTVYVVEGEKDVHALESLGAVATTSPMGAGNFGKVDASPLSGAHVVVVPDQDKEGRRYLDDALAVLDGLTASVRVARPKVGKDAADHVAAGRGLDELVTVPTVTGHRSVRLTVASSIKVRPVKWLWAKRVPLGTLVLLAGREGIGKSTVAYTLAGQITRGDLPGVYTGQPRGVIVAATEDSWEHTIVPRLIAAGADLDRVHRVDVATSEGVDTGLSLPRDLRALEEAALSVDCALILLDPLMSRLDGKLDTHKDAEVRTALEPLVAVAGRAKAAILGLIHVNKSVSTDALTTIMGSRAFAAVARAVLFVMTDPDDDDVRLLGQPKNNLGSVNLPTLTFRIESAHVADTEEGPVWTGRVNWLGESNRSISEALESASDSIEGRSATAEAADWLLDHLTSHGGTDDSASIKAEGGKAGHSLSTLKRARHRLRATSEASGFPRRTYWTLPGIPIQLDQHSGSNPGESGLTEPTGPTGPTHVQSVQLDQSDQAPARDEPIADSAVPNP